jgi:hypothetical protein
MMNADYAINKMNVMIFFMQGLKTAIVEGDVVRELKSDHANNLASKIRSNLTNSLKALGVDILTGFGTVVVSGILYFS